jgi:glycosyltransferase involved in cell wall biosynthesis
LLAQEYPSDRYEVIIVDNNSTDGSAQMVAGYPRVRLLHEPVQGDYAARNRGIREARGDVFAFTDSDTAPRPDWLRAIVAHLDEDGAQLLVGRNEFPGDSRTLQLLEAYEAEKGEFVFGSSIPQIYFGYTCNMAVRRSLIERLGPFPAIYRNADVALVRRTVDQLSPRALAFCDTMRARRLEMASVGKYLRKQILYGRDFPRYSALVAARTLSARQRFRVFGRAVRRNGLGLFDSVRLLTVLAVGAVCYDVGRRRSTAARLAYPSVT